MSAETTFQPGDIVSFCEEEGTVVENNGNSGWVAIDDVTHVRWYWEFQGEPVKLIKRKDRNASR